MSKRDNAIIIEKGYAEIATPEGRLFTYALGTGRYVRIEPHAQQLCKFARRTGNTLTYHSDEQLARDCGATLYKTRKGFEAAAKRIIED